MMFQPLPLPPELGGKFFGPLNLFVGHRIVREKSELIRKVVSVLKCAPPYVVTGVAYFSRILVPQLFDDLVNHMQFVAREMLQDWIAESHRAVLFVRANRLHFDTDRAFAH